MSWRFPMFNLFKKKMSELIICSPLTGELSPLSSSPDEAFSTGLVGQGICIHPSSDTLFCPIDGTVEIFHTLHAAFFKTAEVELVVHIGMNTVSLQGEGFSALTELQIEGSVGLPIIKFDRKFIESKVDTLITPIVIASQPDTAKLEILKESGKVEPGDPIMKIIF